MATKAAARPHRKRQRKQPLIPHLQPLNVWAVLGSNGSAGVVTVGKGTAAPTQLSNGETITFATKLGDTANKVHVGKAFVKWTQRHASFIHRGAHGSSNPYTLLNSALGHGGALTHVKDEATGDPIPGIVFVTVASAGAATALGIPGAILGSEAGGAAEGAAAGAGAGAAEGAAGGAVGGGGAAKIAGKAAAGLGAGAIAGLFTNVGWWKGLGMIVIGIILGILAIREFSP